MKPRFGPGIGERFAAAKATDAAVAAPGRAYPARAAGARPAAAGRRGRAGLSDQPLPRAAAHGQHGRAGRDPAGDHGRHGDRRVLRTARGDIAGRTVNGVPVGISLVAGPGFDRGLLAFACDAAAVLGLPVGAQG